MDAGDLTQIVVTAVGSGGLVGGLLTLLTLRQRREQLTAEAVDKNASANERIMNAGADIVEQAAANGATMAERVTRLEANNDNLRVTVDELRGNYNAVREDLAAERAWRAAMSGWASHAVKSIHDLGGTIEDPPPPPVDRRAPATPTT